MIGNNFIKQKSFQQLEESQARLNDAKNALNEARLKNYELRYPHISRVMIQSFNEFIQDRERKIPEDNDLFIAREKRDLKSIEQELQEHRKKNKIQDKLISCVLCAAVVCCIAAAMFLFCIGHLGGMFFLGLASLLNMLGESLLMTKLHQPFSPLGPLRGSFWSCYHAFKNTDDDIRAIKAKKRSIQEHISLAIPVLKKMCADIETRHKIQNQLEILKANLKKPQEFDDVAFWDGMQIKLKEPQPYNYLQKAEVYDLLLKQLNIADRFLAEK